MSKKYTGVANDKRYTGKDIDITYNVRRCIHAEECVRNLPEVFNTRKRPWIDPADASADRVMEVVVLCPSGALHAFPHTQIPGESIPAANTIFLQENGYLRVVGNLRLSGTTVDIEQETRVSLCRCGQSANKPFCDNTHLKIEFQAPSPQIFPFEPEEMDYPPGAPLNISFETDGPIKLNGPFEIRTPKGELVDAGDYAMLCRCGGSRHKPFCDSTHKKNGFQAQ
jgi:CDGSH-type Zn-finger protein/uncharacterized Fe-S cluster protein YjdI